MPDQTLDRFQGAFVGCLIGNILGSLADKLTKTEIREFTEGAGITGFEQLELFSLRSDLPYRGKFTEAFNLPAALTWGIVTKGKYDFRESFRQQLLVFREKPFVHEGANSRSFRRISRLASEDGYFTDEFPGFVQPEDPTLSRGNGVIKRIWPLGLYFGLNEGKLTRRSELIDIVVEQGFRTHFNIMASIGAFAVVQLFRHIVRFPDATIEAHIHHSEECLSEMEKIYHQTKPDALRDRLRQTLNVSWEDPERISGFVWDAVPFMFHVFLHYSPSFEAGLLRVINAGGSTCTNGAIMGAILGAHFGRSGIPVNWQKAVPHFDAAMMLGSDLHSVSI